MPSGYLILSKLVPCPLPSYFMLFSWAPSRATMLHRNLLERQRENSWPLGGKYCIISNPSRNSGLHLPCFPQHVWQQNLSLDLLEWVTGTQSLLEVHLLVASLQGQLGFQRQCLPLWELALQAIWTKALTTLILKLQTYPWIKSPFHFYGTSGLLPLTNSYNLQPCPLYRQHHSTQLIKRHLTGADNPLFCHSFCYYLQQFFDNEMFTIGNTLNFSYGELGEELSDLYYLKRIRLMAFCQVPGLRAQVWIALPHGIYSHLWWTNQQWVKMKTP